MKIGIRNSDIQQNSLKQAGCDKIFEDKMVHFPKPKEKD